jgi:translation initiation factor 2B subunit (eIF-2B alpha/beta/delta family)
MATDAWYPLPADIAMSIQAIRDDQEHGASSLARAAADVLLRLIEPRDEVPDDTWDAALRTAAHALLAARPSMAAVANTVARIWDAGQSAAAPSTAPLTARQAWREMAARLARQDAKMQHSLLAHAENAVAGVVYTISRSGTVEDVLRELGQRHSIERVLVAESRPGGEGVALGRTLAQGGLAVTLVADAACGIFIGEATCVVLGADSLRADGSLVNKVGSYPLALVAREAGKPVYVLCETLKIAAPDFPLVLEEKDPTELLPDPAAGFGARNPYFDVTPAALIAGYITEQGVLERDTIVGLAQAAGAALARFQAA